MEAIEESPTPDFATAVRGYDRMQVDDYVEHLNQWVEQADVRAQQCEDAAARATAELDEMRRKASISDAESLTATPTSMHALGQRVGAIMQSSFRAARDLQTQAENDARAAVGAAEEQAARIVAEAAARADELTRAAEDLFRQAQEVVAEARDAAVSQIEEARERGNAQADELVERARSEAQELAAQSASTEASSRERLAHLEEQRAEVLTEISTLRERLGSIGDGFGSTDERECPSEPLAQDDASAVLEMPAVASSTQRRAATSAR